MTGVEVVLQEVAKSIRSGDKEIVAVDTVTMDVPAGGVVALTGPSGSGKSTLPHLVGAIDRPDSGTIEVGGLVVETLRRRELVAYRRTVGFVFQRYHLLADEPTATSTRRPARRSSTCCWACATSTA